MVAKPLPFIVADDGPHGEPRGMLAQHGYLFLKDALPRDRVLEVRRDVIALCREAGWVAPCDDPLEARWSGAGPFTEGESPYMEVYRRVLHLDSFKQLPEDPAIVSLMERILGAPVLVHRRKIGRITFPSNTAQTTGAHQDFFYIRGATETYTVWMPLGDCPIELGGLVVVPGSHKRGFIEHVTVPGKKYAGFGIAEEALNGLPWHAGDFQAGDVLIFHSHTVHKALPNLTRDQLRLSMDNRYQRAGDLIEPSSMQTHYDL